MDHIPTTQIIYSLIFGIAFFVLGMIIEDLYIMLGGTLLITIWVIVETGEKVIQHIQPKGL